MNDEWGFMNELVLKQNPIAGEVIEKKYSSYEVTGDKNSYEWVLEEAGAKVLAFGEFGSYQGDWLAKVEYKGKVGWIRDYYGSCSGCDAFEAESYWVDRTKEGWHEFAVEFAKDYLDDLLTYDEVLKIVSENIEWDMDAKDMVKFVEGHR